MESSALAPIGNAIRLSEKWTRDGVRHSTHVATVCKSSGAGFCRDISSRKGSSRSSGVPRSGNVGECDPISILRVLHEMQDERKAFAMFSSSAANRTEMLRARVMAPNGIHAWCSRNAHGSIATNHDLLACDATATSYRGKKAKMCSITSCGRTDCNALACCRWPLMFSWEYRHTAKRKRSEGSAASDGQLCATPRLALVSGLNTTIRCERGGEGEKSANGVSPARMSLGSEGLDACMAAEVDGSIFKIYTFCLLTLKKKSETKMTSMASLGAPPQARHEWVHAVGYIRRGDPQKMKLCQILYIARQQYGVCLIHKNRIPPEKSIASCLPVKIWSVQKI